MMIAVAGGAMNCVPLRFLSAPGRSPHGSLSYLSAARRGVIYAPFLSAHFPVWGMGNGHEHERMSGGK